MHKNESADSEHGNELALSNDIKVDSSKTPNHDVFLVYRGNRHWERLAELAKRDGIPRDKAINLLKSGIGRYWQLRRLGHNEFRYSLL
jgi:hypothetical protein